MPWDNKNDGPWNNNNNNNNPWGNNGNNGRKGKKNSDDLDKVLENVKNKFSVLITIFYTLIVYHTEHISFLIKIVYFCINHTCFIIYVKLL